jgi:hypothetical protein
MDPIRPQDSSERGGQMTVLGGDDATTTGASGPARNDKLPDRH